MLFSGLPLLIVACALLAGTIVLLAVLRPLQSRIAFASVIVSLVAGMAMAAAAYTAGMSSWVDTMPYALALASCALVGVVEAVGAAKAVVAYIRGFKAAESAVTTVEMTEKVTSSPQRMFNDSL